MSANHTPGPWAATKLARSIGIYDASGTTVAVVAIPGPVSEPRKQADARLISAAPELLSALEALVTQTAQICDGAYSDEIDKAYADARAAILKATGSAA